MSPIELIAIAKHYRSIKAAGAVDLPVEEGELVTILGPSSSGNTTHLILIAGLAPSTSGQP